MGKKAGKYIALQARKLTFSAISTPVLRVHESSPLIAA
jgi:hypothetical protein